MDAEFFKIVEDSFRDGLTQEEIIAFTKPKRGLQIKLNKSPFNYKSYVLLTLLITILYALKNPRAYEKPWQHIEEFKEAYLMGRHDACVLEHTVVTMGMFRPVSKCTICENVAMVPVVHNLSREYFLKHHAYTGVPVLAKGYADSWSALRVFNYNYFKSVYNRSDLQDEDECQFFPYKTNFVTLKQVFQMSKKRAKLLKDQWYVGWSNCVPEIAKIFRQHYRRPTFLPTTSESSQTDWIFMGGSGYGAGIHIDNVNRPSWQAQIMGKKKWILEPAPECEYVCKRHLEVTMDVGDILIVDTNLWYHGTYVYPGNMSITIGSEYD